MLERSKRNWRPFASVRLTEEHHFDLEIVFRYISPSFLAIGERYLTSRLELPDANVPQQSSIIALTRLPFSRRARSRGARVKRENSSATVMAGTFPV
jgi:hypothetical protein